MSVLVPEFMSSEDSDMSKLVHPIKWRSAKADVFFKTLDAVINQRDNGTIPFWILLRPLIAYWKISELGH